MGARPGVTRAVVLALISKLLGLALLLGSCALLYDVASSNELRVNRVSVAGNRLLSTADLEGAASVSGMNLFWIRRSDIVRRLRQLPPVESAEVKLSLPDHLHIQVKERDPVAIWLAGEVPYLVDRDGLVLTSQSADQPLMVIRDMSGQPLAPGSRVSADAVGGVGRLDALLSQAFGPQQRQYEHVPETGLNVVQSVGPRLIIGTGEGLEGKISAIRTIVRHLESIRRSAEVIDVRFQDRPYFR